LIIVEGPDGAGKTTLIQKLLSIVPEYWGVPWELAPRVVSKDTSALVDLKEWTENNLDQGFQRRIFDRHRLLSDPIYRIALGKPFDPELYSSFWLTKAWNTFLNSVEPYIIYCLPPLEVIKANLEGDLENIAVINHVDQIYMGYVSQLALLTSLYDYIYTYDYTQPNALDNLMNRLGKDF